jgi:hypothetical protein
MNLYSCCCCLLFGLRPQVHGKQGIVFYYYGGGFQGGSSQLKYTTILYYCYWKKKKIRRPGKAPGGTNYVLCVGVDEPSLLF